MRKMVPVVVGLRERAAVLAAVMVPVVVGLMEHVAVPAAVMVPVVVGLMEHAAVLAATMVPIEVNDRSNLNTQCRDCTSHRIPDLDWNGWVGTRDSSLNFVVGFSRRPHYAGQYPATSFVAWDWKSACFAVSVVCSSALLATQCFGIQQCLSVLAPAGSLVGLGFFGGLPSSLERVANCVWLRRAWGVRLCSKQRFRDLCCLLLSVVVCCCLLLSVVAGIQSDCRKGAAVSRPNYGWAI